MSSARSVGSVWAALLVMGAACGAFAGERINHAGRILGPAPVVTTPTQFNTTQGDAFISAMQIFPRDNAWYDVVSSRPVLSNSNAMIAKIKAELAAKGANRQTLRVFSEMNYIFVPDNQAKVDVRFVDYPDESDDLKPGSPDIGSLPFPSNVPVEGWPSTTGSLTLEQHQRDVNGDGGDRHSIVIMPGTGFIWEQWQTYLTTRTPVWEASNCAKFNLNSNARRPLGWTSADAAGLPMLPALVRFDECERGEIEHALRLIVAHTRREYLYPASHHASNPSTTDVDTPAMGQRIRLKASFVVPANWTKQEKAVCAAFKKYGALVADNGGFFSISACPDQRFPAGCFNNLSSIDINNFEVVVGYGETEGPRSAGAPTANAGPDVSGTVAGGASLNGSVTGSGLTISWYAYPGVTQPGTVGFGTPSAAVTTATFSAAGTYTLMLKADDGVHTPAYDAVIVTVTSGPPDTTAPVVTITSPTSNSTHAVSATPLNIGGTASDNVSVTQVTWSNDRGGNGTATGTTAWSVNGIVLQSGANVLTVTARDAAGNTSTDTLTVTYTIPPPAEPTGLTATATSSTQINLTWTDASNNESGFKLERKTGAGGTYAQIATPATNATSYSDTGLAASTTYFYRIRSTNTAGDSAYSNEVSATTQSPPPPPAAPSGLTATATSTTQINLTWTDNATTETGFKLERKTGAGGTYAQIATPAANATSYSNTGLTASTTYFYRIRATNAAGDSAYSNEVSATTQSPPPPPAAPSGLTATATSTTQINLTWADNANNETGFKLERKTGAGGTYAQIATSATNATAFSNTGLAASTTYFYRIRATNAAGDSAFSNEVSATTQSPPPVPATPTGLVATAISTTQINLAWTDVATNETGYRVERKTGAAGTYAQIATPGANATAYSDTNCAPNTQYFYRVRANNAGGNSGYSNEANATTPNVPPVAPAAPTDLLAAGVSQTRIALLWTDAANNESGYEVERSSDGVAFSALATLPADSNSHNDDGLPVATGFYYRVRAVNGGAVSAYSNSAFAVTTSGGGGGGGPAIPPGQGENEDFDGDGVMNGVDADDDNDGIADSDELAAGTNPFDFFSGTVIAMTVSKLAGAMNFTTEGKDGCSISGVLPSLPAKIDLTGKTLTLNIGGATQVFLLDAKGRGKNESSSITLKLKPSTRNKTTKVVEFLGGDVAFKGKLSKGTWSDDWADEGATGGADVKNQALTLTATIDLGGKVYMASVSVLYSAKAGKMGRMKK